MLSCEQSPRSAFNGNAFPTTVGVLARNSRIFKRKANIVGNKQVQVSIAVVIHEGAACSKPLLIAPKAGGLGHIGESSVAVVAVKSVLPEIRAKDVVKAIVVVVADANSTGPSEKAQPRFFCNIRKRSVAIVFVKPIRRAVRRTSKSSAGEYKYIHPAVIVVIDEGATTSGRLHDVFLDFCVAVDHRRIQARGSRDVHEMGVEGAPGSSRSWHRLCGVS